MFVLLFWFLFASKILAWWCFTIALLFQFIFPSQIPSWGRFSHHSRLFVSISFFIPDTYLRALQSSCLFFCFKFSLRPSYPFEGASVFMVFLLFQVHFASQIHAWRCYSLHGFSFVSISLRVPDIHLRVLQSSRLFFCFNFSLRPRYPLEGAKVFTLFLWFRFLFASQISTWGCYSLHGCFFVSISLCVPDICLRALQSSRLFRALFASRRPAWGRKREISLDLPRNTGRSFFVSEGTFAPTKTRWKGHTILILLILFGIHFDLLLI